MNKPPHPLDHPAPVAGRRSLLLSGLALAASALPGCGGGGGGSGGDGGGGGGGNPTSGHLVYRNSGRAGVFAFANRSETTFDPGVEPFIDPGVAVAGNGWISVARNGSNTGFSSALYNLAGQQVDIVNVTADFAFQTSAMVFNADASRLAFSLNDNTGLERTWVVDWASGNLLQTFNGYEEPVWAGNSGDLILRDAATDRLFVTGPALGTPVALGIQITSLIGSYATSPDGSVIVWSNGDRIQAVNRSTNAAWVAATSATSSTNSPVVSPDGRWLALLARANQIYVPHVVPFAAGSTVAVVATQHQLPVTLVDCSGRIGWTAA